MKTKTSAAALRSYSAAVRTIELDAERNAAAKRERADAAERERIVAKHAELESAARIACGEDSNFVRLSIAAADEADTVAALAVALAQDCGGWPRGYVRDARFILSVAREVWQVKRKGKPATRPTRRLYEMSRIHGFHVRKCSRGNALFGLDLCGRRVEFVAA